MQIKPQNNNSFSQAASAERLIEGGKPEFSKEEKEAHAQIAQELGFNSPKELGDAIKNNPELKAQVEERLKEMGIEPKSSKRGPRFSPEEKKAHQEIAKKLGFENPRELGDAMKKNPELRKEVKSQLKEMGFEAKAPKGNRPPPPPPKSDDTLTDTSELSSEEQQAVAYGFGTADSPDVSAYKEALKSGDLLSKNVENSKLFLAA